MTEPISDALALAPLRLKLIIYRPKDLRIESWADLSPGQGFQVDLDAGTVVSGVKAEIYDRPAYVRMMGRIVEARDIDQAAQVLRLGMRDHQARTLVAHMQQALYLLEGPDADAP